MGDDENEPIDEKKKDETYVYPKNCGHYTIVGIRDLTVGIEVDFRDEGKDKKPVLPCSSANQMITFYFDNACEMTIRASGTEPKIKWYSEIRKKRKDVEPTNENPMIDDEEFRRETRKELQDLVDTVVHEFLQPEKNQLGERETSRK
jgi:phosphomannomutase